jgi:hypothetical protein
MKGTVLTAAVMVAMAGCTPEWAKRGEAQNVLLITGVNDTAGGAPLQSDVLTSGGGVCPDRIGLRLENHFKNPNVTNTGFRGDMVVERYEIRYFRSDGRNQQGVDVPYTITGNVSQEVRSGEAATLNLEVVRLQAKLEPPLVNLRRNLVTTPQGLAPTGTGGTVITVFAEITLHARMTTLQVTNSATTRMQIDFADFADNTTTCPT